MFDGIECLGEIKLQNSHLSPRGLTLVYELERPCPAILYRSPFQEAALVTVYDLEDDML